MILRKLRNWWWSCVFCSNSGKSISSSMHSKLQGQGPLSSLPWFLFCALAVDSWGIHVSGTILAKTRAIAPVNSGAKSMTCYNRCQELLAGQWQACTRREGSTEGVLIRQTHQEKTKAQGKKRLVSAFLEMGMSEATSPQRLPAAGATSNIAVSRSQCDKPLNKLAAAPSNHSSLKQFPSEPRVECIGVIEK